MMPRRVTEMVAVWMVVALTWCWGFGIQSVVTKNGDVAKRLILLARFPSAPVKMYEKQALNTVYHPHGQYSTDAPPASPNNTPHASRLITECTAW